VANSILAVDDSAPIRGMVSFTLKGAGYDVIEAVDGKDGLAKAKAKAKAFDLVLTDQNMPCMDGLSMVRALRQLPGYRTAPILILTTESGVEMKSRGKAAGATGWLVKPFDPQSLIELVRKVIG
jgi:two-component system, chemotaxis family, chemotaxis protein CheY